MQVNKQAEELNNIIKENNPVIYNLLSKKGRAIFFPKKGILSQAAQAQGKRLNATLGTAIEDNGSPMRLDTVADKINLNPQDIFPYSSSYGKLELRRKWKELMLKKNPSLNVEFSLPVVTQALTHGLSMVSYLFINSEDEIILADKFWGNYKLIFEHGYGAKLDTFNTFNGKGFDLESFKEKLNDGSGERKDNKKIVLFNFPNNPTGYTLTEEEANEIIEIIKNKAEQGKEILVILDDAYFGLVYENGIFKESLFSKLANLHENVLAVKVDGATKEDYVWGLRVGFLTYGGRGITLKTCQVLEDKTAGAIRGNISNASNLSQSLLLAAYDSLDYETEKLEKYNILQSRYEKVKEVLKDQKFKEVFTSLPFNSGYFMCVELKVGLDAQKVRRVLLEKYDTGIIVFGNLIRVAYSSVAEKDLSLLFENIYLACQEV